MDIFSELEEFLLYSTSSSIHRITFGTKADLNIPVNNMNNIEAIDYDYSNNCAYWADANQDVIQVSPDAHHSPCILLVID